MNKVVVSLIVVLFVISICAGAFAFVLNGKIGTLDSDVLAFKANTATQFNTVKSDISSVDSSLNNFKTDTVNQFSDVQSDITSLDSNLSSFKTDTASRFSSVQTAIDKINTDVAGLDNNLSSLSAQYNESTMNVRRVYDDVIGSVCRIVGDSGSGSGFIYSVQGSVTNIVTCWHVVDGQSYLDVILHDGTCKRATIIGSDRDSDVAVIKISGVSNLKPLPLADSNALDAGEPIIVVGNPLGIFETVVYGIISRIRQMVYVGGVGWVANLIQYDAAQNPGNSGGPVFDSKGHVVGIAQSNNTAGEGIKNAVSSNKVKRVADAIIDNGSYDNAMLPGTWSMDDLTAETAITRGLDSAFGVIVLRASGMGDVQANDIITAVDGIAIRDGADLFSYLAEFKSVGDTIKLTLIRGSGTEIEVTLTLIKGWLQR